MAASVYWWPFYPYTIPHGDNDQTQDVNAFYGFLYDILVQMFKTCQPNLDIGSFLTTRFTIQQDFMTFLTKPDVPNGTTHVYVPVSVQVAGCYLERLQHQMLPDSTFLPILESPGEVNSNY